MRKQKTFEAYLDDLSTISVYQSKAFYNGISCLFKLRDAQGNLSELPIIDSIDEGDYYRYTLKAQNVVIGQEYEVLNDHHLVTTLAMGYVVRTKAFDDLFYYDGDDLGAVYTKEATTLKLWAPTASAVKTVIQKAGKDTGLKAQTFELERGGKGVWSLTLEGDYEGWAYVYLVKVNGQWQEATDPYARASMPNAKRSVIIDPKKAEVPLNKECLPPLESYTDAILYEVHVRDLSVHENSGITHKGKFLGLAEEGTRTSRGTLTGLDYIADLGITHVQLMPVYDFGSVDELNQFAFYNWGYDPVQYNVPEGSYATNVWDPYSSITELKRLIAKLHEKGLRVTMDVVYNHMFNKDTSSFDKIVPDYYFRLGPNGEISNGSFCTNDMDSTRRMTQKFFLDSTKMWVRDYGIDGFRFDLMGILDVETMNLIADECMKLDPSLMIYGEGWNMPTLLDEEKKATIQNHHKLPKLAFFNDRFYTVLRGHALEDPTKPLGYLSGATRLAESVKNVLAGSVTTWGGLEPYFMEPTQSINYIECHDNHTFWDKLSLCNSEDDEDTREKRHRLGLGMILVSQGIAFIHAGQEFFRTKNGTDNSYMSPDAINRLDWDRKDQYISNVNYAKDLIALRKSLKALRLRSSQEIQEHVDIEVLDNGVVIYTLENVRKYGEYDEILMIINPNKTPFSLELEAEYRLLADYHGLSRKEAGVRTATVRPFELLVLAR